MDMLTEINIASAPRDIEARATEAWQRAERIAADGRLNNAAKADDVAQIMKAAAAAIEERTAPLMAALGAEMSELAAIAAPTFTPSAEDAPRLMYVRDALLARWSVTPHPKALSDWRDALADGDLITARVYRDHYPAVWQEIMTREARRSINPDARATEQGLTKEVTDLIERTDAALMTPAQREAAARLIELRDKRDKIADAQRQHLSRIKGARYDSARRGLMDGISASVKPLNF